MMSAVGRSNRRGGRLVSAMSKESKIAVLSNEVGKFVDLATDNFKSLVESVALQNEMILQLMNEVDLTNQKLALSNQHLLEIASREENLDVLPFTPVSSTCSSGMGDLSLAKLQDQQEQQDIKPKMQRLSQAATTQPNPDPLESNQTKQPISWITRSKSAKIGKMQELSSITADDAYLGNYDSVKAVSENTNSHLEPCFEPDLSLRKSKKKTKGTC